MVEIQPVNGKWVADSVAWTVLAESYPVKIEYQNRTIRLPVWGTVLPDADHHYGRWAAGVIDFDTGPVLMFSIDPEVLLHTGARLSFYNGSSILFTVTIL